MVLLLSERQKISEQYAAEPGDRSRFLESHGNGPAYLLIRARFKMHRLEEIAGFLQGKSCQRD